MLRSDVSPRWAVMAVVLCDLAMMSLAIAANLLPVFLTTLSIDLGGPAGLSEEQLGRIGAVTFTGLVLGIVIAGPLADRWGCRLFAVGGNLLVAIGLAGLGLARTYPLLLAGSFVMGVGAGTLDMVLSPIVSALQPHRRTAAMNLLHSFYCIGAVMTILIASLALHAGIGWRTAALGMLGMPLLVGLAFAAVPLPPMVAGGHTRMPLRSLARHPYFLVACVAIFLGGAAEMGLAFWLPTYAEQSLGYTKWTAGMAALGFATAMAVGRLVIAVLPRRIGPIQLMLGCCAVSVGLFPLASFAPMPWMALAASVAVGLTASCLWPSTLAVAADRFPTGGATMFAILAALGNFGGIVMPWLVGAVALQSDLHWGLATATLCPLLMIAALLWMGRREQATDVIPLAPAAGA